MEEKYINIKQATSLSGKSEYEIRKWTQAQQALQEAQQATQEALQQAQQPSEEAQQPIEPIEPIEIKVRREHQTSNPNSPLVYMIREDIILEVFGKKEEGSTSPIGENNQQQQAQQAPQQASEATQQAQQISEDSLVDFLKGQIEKKDRQIEHLEKQVDLERGEKRYFMYQLNPPKTQTQEVKEEGKEEVEGGVIKDIPEEEIIS